MTQRLIYGKTVRLQGDSLSFDGATFMDPFDDTGVVSPINFIDTATATYSGIVFGGQGAGTQVATLLMTRNGGRVRLEMPAQVGVVTPTGTTLTLQIPAQANNPFYPVVTRNFVYNVFNATTIQQGVGTISTTGLVTFTGLTGGVGYTFLYGVTTSLYN